ncbi:MAG: rhodanese-like domain-containing protein [Deltaproteobacteria bacterium]|nr:rhodanese-like domain-containing protein [Deltaproteobacteria bacterium]
MPVRLSPAEAHALLRDEGYVYVDVRSVPEYEGGRPEGSYNIPLMNASPAGLQPNPEFLAVMEAFLDAHPKVVLGCQGGNRSMRAAEALEARGRTGLREQRAGWGGARNAYGQVAEPGWSAAGLPAASGPDPERGYAALKK